MVDVQNKVFKAICPITIRFAKTLTLAMCQMHMFHMLFYKFWQTLRVVKCC